MLRTRLILQFVIAFVVYSVAPASSIATPRTLQDYYALALNHSKTLAVSEQEYAAAETKYTQTLSAIYPKLYFEANYTQRDNSDFGRITRGRSSVEDIATPTAGIGGTIGRSQNSGGLLLTQPIFHGFREFLIADAASSEVKATKLLTEREKTLLFEQVARIFLQLHFAYKELGIYKVTSQILNDRVAELIDFVALGRARDGDIISAKQELADLTAQITELTGMIAATKEAMAFLTGIENIGEIETAEISDDIQLNGDIEHYLELTANREDLSANKLLYAAQEDRTKATARERWPSIDLQARAYGWDDPDRNRDWELGIAFSLPLFDGGNITAKEKLAEQQLRIIALRNKEAVEIAARDVRIAFTNFQTSREQRPLLKKLITLAEENYNAQKKDFTNGIVTNLDVLEALRRLQESKRRMLSAERTYHLNWHILQVAAGAINK